MNETRPPRAEDSPEPVPPSIPDFTLTRRLGRGGFGEVWLGKSLTGVHRAVKTIDRNAHPEIEFEGIRVYERRVTDHAHLIDVRHVGETDTHFYYVMELADGYSEAPTFSAEDYEPRTLESELARRGHLPEEEAIAVTADVARGLAHLHSLGLLHRDVKPANIVYACGRAKLADLGLVGRTDGSSSPGLTPSYAPPEGVLGPDGDLYCLGRVLFEMLSGGPASEFPAFPPDADPARIAAISRAMPMIDRACAPDRGGRYSKADAFLSALGEETARETMPPSLRPVRPARSPLSRAALLLIGIGLIWAAVAQPWRPDSSSGPLPPPALGLLYKETPESPAAVRLTADTAPLRTGDLVALTARFPTPEYLLVAQLEHPAAGNGIEVTILNEDAGQAAVTEWRGPENPTEWWPIAPPEGTLVFVLLGSDEPIEDVEGVTHTLARLDELPTLSPRHLLRLHGSVAALEEGLGGTTRGIADRKTTVGETRGGLESLASLLGEKFTRIEAIAVPQVPGPPTTPPG